MPGVAGPFTLLKYFLTKREMLNCQCADGLNIPGFHPNAPDITAFESFGLQVRFYLKTGIGKSWAIFNWN